VDVVERDEADAAAPSPSSAPARRRRPPLALVLALVALVCAALLPLAPVEMSTPTVNWPQDPTRPVSTMLELNNVQPRSLDVTFTCAAARAAGSGVVVSTLLPDHPAALTDGLLVTVDDGTLTVLDRGRTALAEPLPAGDCRYRLQGTAEELTVTRDGTQVGQLRPDGDTGVLPDVDVLATDASRVAAGDLHVTLAVDDQFDTTPAPLKKVLIVVLLVAAIGSLVALRRADGPAARPEEEPAAPSGGTVRRLIVLVDVAVVATMLLWWFIAPLSDDDGYYAAMARNAESTGFVGNYYQLFNQSFTPFTWFYRLLGWWQVVGDSPVVLRVPSLVVGLGTYVLLRRYVLRPAAQATAVAGWRRLGTVVLLGLTFLAWWLPYGMGVRPEAVVAVLAMATLSCVFAGLRGGRLFPIGVGFGCAGLAVACHPTGFVALAPLLVALPRLIPLVRAGTDRLGVVTRVALLLAPGALPVAAAFADGSLNDFRRGQELFLSIAQQQGWGDEWMRYMYLLTPGPMGSYARRAAVVLAIVGLAWFVVLAVSARVRGVRLPLGLGLAGASLGLAFLLLWLTPSKWTHHFGALSGIGPAFLTLVLMSAAPLVRQVTGGRRLGWPVAVGVLGSACLAFALSLQGLNSWAYTWLPGMLHPGIAPAVGPIRFGNLLLWLVGVGLLVAVVAFRRRRGGPGRSPAWLVALPLAVVVFLGLTVAGLVGSFAIATVRTADTWSPWAAALTDPLSSSCDAASAVHVSDLDAARPAAVAVPAADPPPGSAFVSGSGWWPPNPPPTPAGQAVATDVWGTLSEPGAEDRTGSMTTSWYRLPEVGEGEDLVVLAAGRLNGGNTLTVEYGTGSGEPTVVRSKRLTDTVDTPAWRTFVLDAGAARAAGATTLRLVADDVTGGSGGWLAFTGPSVAPLVPLTSYLPADAPVGVAWQIAFLFPCQQQPLVRHGITEPVGYGVLWVDNPASSDLNDATWAADRGLFGSVQRTSSVTRLATTVDGSPGIESIVVYRFGLPYRTDAYDLDPGRTQRLGWQGP
jgi:hypothetical protein